MLGFGGIADLIFTVMGKKELHKAGQKLMMAKLE
jgi:hypothetical protein